MYWRFSTQFSEWISNWFIWWNSLALILQIYFCLFTSQVLRDVTQFKLSFTSLSRSKKLSKLMSKIQNIKEPEKASKIVKSWAHWCYHTHSMSLYVVTASGWVPVAWLARLLLNYSNLVSLIFIIIAFMSYINRRIILK